MRITTFFYDNINDDDSTLLVKIGLSQPQIEIIIAYQATFVNV